MKKPFAFALLALAQSLNPSAQAAEDLPRTRDLYFCNQVVKAAKPADLVMSTEGGKKVWTIESHVLIVYAGGRLQRVISLDGVNPLTRLGPDDFALSKPRKGFDTYSMETNSGLADEWGADVLLEKGLIDSKGSGRMILHRGSEEGRISRKEFVCVLNEGRVWKEAEH